jgi:DNA helicase-2/ATP-dependent DNA helicase PcrA
VLFRSDELPQEEIHRERLRPSSWSGYGSPTARVQSRSDVPQLSTGDSVRHQTLGEGVVTAVEPGGVVSVRFAGEGVDRRLVLDYAPLERVG